MLFSLLHAKLDHLTSCPSFCQKQVSKRYRADTTCRWGTWVEVTGSGRSFRSISGQPLRVHLNQKTGRNEYLEFKKIEIWIEKGKLMILLARTHCIRFPSHSFQKIPLQFWFHRAKGDDEAEMSFELGKLLMCFGGFRAFFRNWSFSEVADCVLTPTKGNWSYNCSDCIYLVYVLHCIYHSNRLIYKLILKKIINFIHFLMILIDSYPLNLIFSFPSFKKNCMTFLIAQGRKRRWGGDAHQISELFDLFWWF